MWFSRRENERDRLAFVALVDCEIAPVSRDDRMIGKQFAHPDDSEVAQVWLSIGKARGQLGHMHAVFLQIKG